ncbi:MAG: hypothetical protein ABIG60_02080 [Patescibacteria group bacterium]
MISIKKIVFFTFFFGYIALGILFLKNTELKFWTNPKNLAHFLFSLPFFVSAFVLYLINKYHYGHHFFKKAEK